MKLLARIIAAVIVNGVALYAADHFIVGFTLDVADLRGQPSWPERSRS